MRGKQYEPQFKRRAVARLAELTADYGMQKAAEMVAEELGIRVTTLQGWRYGSGMKRAIAGEEYTQLHRALPSVPQASSDYELSAIETPQEQPAAQRTLEIPIQNERLLELVVSDIHFPYEDAAGYALFLEVARDLQPQVLVLLGDIMDCYAVSAHDKDADRATPRAFSEELVYTRAKLVELRALLPATRIIYKEGNHETRLRRYISKNAGVLSKTKGITLPELLALRELNVEWVTNEDRLRIGRMWHIHGNEVGGGGMNPARLKYQRMQCSFIFGHLHTRDKYRPRAYDGSQHGAYANPCMCNLEAEYLHHAHNWSLGFTIIDHDTDRTFQVDEIEVIKPYTQARSAKANVRGRIYVVSL
jgi:predicted phosphodiesterase/transposase-like protein